MNSPKKPQTQSFELFYYLLYSIIGASIFFFLFSLYLFVTFEIKAPIYTLIIPSFFGMIIGLSMAYWRKKSQKLLHEVLQYRENLDEMLTLQIRELEERNQELKKFSFTDSLTGLGNRRLFDRILQKEWNALEQKNAKALSLVMFDIDMFKQYNDTYGHQRGDECLERISHLLQKQVTRKDDLVVRYGGEEFCIILPHTQYNDALIIAENIRKSIKNLHIFHSSSTVNSVVTVSVGVTSIQNIKRYKNCAPLIKTADTALYLAKSQGRNRVDGSKIN
jgi:diguanylate cyclase (GGDEF)-like protein